MEKMNRNKKFRVVALQSGLPGCPTGRELGQWGECRPLLRELEQCPVQREQQHRVPLLCRTPADVVSSTGAGPVRWCRSYYNQFKGAENRRGRYNSSEL